MFCPKCGNQLNEGATFCPKCGANVDAASAPHLQETSSNSINVTGIKKRKSTVIICIGLVLYVVLMCIPSVTNDVPALQEAGYYVEGISSEVEPLIMNGLVLFAVFPILIGLVELICAIKNKKAVFVLSVIQTVLSVPIYALDLMVLSYNKSKGLVVSYSSIVYLPIVASVLLLVGGIMFRKENAISGGTR